jgi:hypothetical protein
VRQHGDALVRRVFSRPDIDEERRALRACLTQALGNITPDRRKTFSSSQQDAVARLEQLARRSMWHDIRASEVKDLLTVLAHGGANAVATPGRPGVRPASSLRPGKPPGPRKHVTMQNLQYDQERERRLHLQDFRNAVNRDASLKSVLFGDDKQANANACLRVVSAVICLYQSQQQEEDSDRVLARLYQMNRGKMLDLFIDVWRSAWQAGKIQRCGFAWADTIDWLVCRFEDAATSAGNTAPTSPAPVKAVAARKPSGPPQNVQAPRNDRHPQFRSRTSSHREGRPLDRSATLSVQLPRSRHSGSMSDGAPGVSLHMRSQARSGFMPGRQAETMPVGPGSGKLVRRGTSSHEQALSGSVSKGGSVISPPERRASSSVGRKLATVRAVLSPQSPLSPISPSSPLFPRFVPIRRSQTEGPGQSSAQSRSIWQPPADALSTREQRAMASPYRPRIAKSAGMLPGLSHALAGKPQKS